MHGVQHAADALGRACLEGAGDAYIDGLLRTVADQLDKVFDELRKREAVTVP